MNKIASQRRAGVILGYANILTKNLVNLVYTPMLLSFVGQADYGVYQSCYSFVFTLTLLSFGFSQAYVRFYTQLKVNGTQEDIRHLNGIYLALFSLVSLIALVCGLFIAFNANAIFSVGFSAEQISIAETTMFFMAFNISIIIFNSVFDAYLLSLEEFRFQQSRQLATTLITPFAAYGLLCLGMGVIGVAVAQLSINIVLLILNGYFCINRLGMRFEMKSFDIKLCKAIAAFSVWIFVNQICDLVNQSVPNVLLGALTSASVVAVFAISVQIRTVFISLSTTISNVFTPRINKLVAESDDNTELTHLMTRAGRYQMILFCWVYGGFILLGEFFILHWAGEGFVDAYWMVLIMTLPLAISLTQNTGIEIQRAKNRHKTRSIAMLTSAVFNVVFTAVAAPYIGYWAPAIAYFIGQVLCQGVFMNWYYHRRIGLNIGFFWRRVLPVVGVGIVITAICLMGTRFLPVNNWLVFFVWGIAYSILFGVAVCLAVLSPQEKAKVFSVIKIKRESGRNVQD